MASSWSFASFVDWLQGNPPGGSGEESGGEAWRRRARPRPRSIPWRPVDGEDPGELFETGGGDEVFVVQSVFRDIRRHIPEHPGEQRYGFLLGRRLVCPATGDPYLLIDEIWSAPDPLRERGGTDQFERALGTAGERAAEGEKDVLGWYHTHSPLMGLRLSEHDVRLHARFFPERWHCALIEVAHGEEPVGGLFQRRERHRYPGTKLISFLEVTEANGAGTWGEMESQLDWTNYSTPRSRVRRVAPPRDPAPVIRASRRHPEEEAPVRRRARPTGPTWRWLPLTPAEPVERRPPPAPETPPPGRAPESAPPQAGTRPAREDRAAPAEGPSRPRPSRQPLDGGLPFRFEASEASVSGGSLARAVDGLRAVVAARKRAAESTEPASRTRPAPESGARSTRGRAPSTRPAAPARRDLPFRADEDAVPLPDIPIVIPPADDEWPGTGRRLAVSLRGARRALLLISLLGAGLFFLLRSEGGSEPLGSDEFHPAAGPGEAALQATAGRVEFERLRASLSESLAAYADRRAEFDLGRTDCRILAAAHRTAQREFLRLSDHLAREEVTPSAPQREAWRDLAAETSAMDRHFETAGCGGAAQAGT